MANNAFREDLPSELPKFYSLAVCNLFGRRDSFGVVGAVQFNRSGEVALLVLKIDAIVSQPTHPVGCERHANTMAAARKWLDRNKPLSKWPCRSISDQNHENGSPAIVAS